jgi:hypothetical protein
MTGNVGAVEAWRDEQVAQFGIMIGASCESARLAGLVIRVELGDGSIVEGVPSEHATTQANEEEFDGSGTRTWLKLGDTAFMTADVRSYTVMGPR